MDDAFFVYSHPVSTQEVQKAGCFTKLHVRIHDRDEIADSANHRLATEWRKAFDEPAISCCANIYAHLANAASLWYLECCLKRLDLASYFTELGFLHDGMLTWTGMTRTNICRKYWKKTVPLLSLWILARRKTLYKTKRW